MCSNLNWIQRVLSPVSSAFFLCSAFPKAARQFLQQFTPFPDGSEALACVWVQSGFSLVSWGVFLSSLTSCCLYFFQSTDVWSQPKYATNILTEFRWVCVCVMPGCSVKGAHWYYFAHFESFQQKSDLLFTRPQSSRVYDPNIFHNA